MRLRTQPVVVFAWLVVGVGCNAVLGNDGGYLVALRSDAGSGGQAAGGSAGTGGGSADSGGIGATGGTGAGGESNGGSGNSGGTGGTPAPGMGGMPGGPGGSGGGGSGSCAPTPTFGAPTSFGVGTTAWFDVGDLDHDGHADVVVASSTAPPLTILHGSAAGLGNAQTPGLPSPCSAAQSVFVKDVDADTFNDLVIAACNQLWLMQQDPAHAGQFFDAVPIVGARVPASATGGVAFGDFNGDGVLDIASTDRTTLAVSLQSATTPRSFTAGPTSAYQDDSRSIAVSLAAADLTGDGKDDLVYINKGSVTVLPQDKPGTFGAPIAIGPSGATSFAVGRIDADSLADVVVAAHPSAVLLQRATPAGSFTSVDSNVTAQLGKFAMLAVDADADGRLDVLIDGDLSLQCHAPLPAATFGSPTPLGGGEIARVADINNDAKPDLLFYDSVRQQLTVEPAR